MSLKPFCEVPPESKDARIARLEWELEAANSRISEARDWIPVGERLPERNGWYLTWEPPRKCKTDSSWTFQARVCIHYFVEEGAPPEYFGVPGFHDERVTHWMPLPKGPK